ncbi:hypothetical protein FRX31_020347 [Thalictrum thalictroides]|uniref:Uncharacterized protein n=1 Tax=Thalictrum thalictroides TaxID=46969 RepID=A0A7J6VYY1_THATH|nr:hypothetical protein FRX31_020347 [Thalictrum thalictroides]
MEGERRLVFEKKSRRAVYLAQLGGLKPSLMGNLSRTGLSIGSFDKVVVSPKHSCIYRSECLTSSK